MSARLSVRLSVTRRYSVETAKQIINVFSLSGSQIILVCPYQTGWQYSDGDPLTGTSIATGYEKITIFDQYLALCRKSCTIQPVTMEGE